jgi:hypothetical protein
MPSCDFFRHSGGAPGDRRLIPRNLPPLQESHNASGTNAVHLGRQRVNGRTNMRVTTVHHAPARPGAEVPSREHSRRVPIPAPPWTSSLPSMTSSPASLQSSDLTGKRSKAVSLNEVDPYAAANRWMRRLGALDANRDPVGIFMPEDQRPGPQWSDPDEPIPIAVINSLQKRPPRRPVTACTVSPIFTTTRRRKPSPNGTGRLAGRLGRSSSLAG